MVNTLTLLLSHAVLAYAIWRLLQRADLDQDPPRGNGPGDA